MKLIADTHTHTIASDHAYSTVLENAQYANAAGLQAMAITDHGPAIPDGPHFWHFVNLKVLPRILHDVIILRGVELNIVSHGGKVDLEPHVLKKLDWVIAGFHDSAFGASTIENHTNAYIGVAKNPLVDVIGHSGQEEFSYDYAKAIKVFKEYDKIVEINESSPNIRKGSTKNCLEIAKLCKKYEVKIVVNTDAHFASAIGRFDRSVKMLEEIEYPEELIVNADLDRLLEYIHQKKGIDIKSEINQ